MRIVHEIHSGAHSFMASNVYTKHVKLEKASSFNVELAISSTCPITKEEELIEIEGDGRVLITILEEILEALRLLEDEYVADGKIVPRDQVKRNEKAYRDLSRKARSKKRSKRRS